MAQATGKLFGFAREIHTFLMEHQDQDEAITYILDKLMTGSNELENAIMRRFKKTRLGIQEPIEGLDYAEAVSRLSLQMTALQAAQQTFTRVQGLSLFNFL